MNSVRTDESDRTSVAIEQLACPEPCRRERFERLEHFLEPIEPIKPIEPFTELTQLTNLTKSFDS